MYKYFDYDVNQAIFLSEEEGTILAKVMQNIQKEYQASTDRLKHTGAHKE